MKFTEMLKIKQICTHVTKFAIGLKLFGINICIKYFKYFKYNRLVFSALFVNLKYSIIYK